MSGPAHAVSGRRYSSGTPSRSSSTALDPRLGFTTVGRVTVNPLPTSVAPGRGRDAGYPVAGVPAAANSGAVDSADGHTTGVAFAWAGLTGVPRAGAGAPGDDARADALGGASAARLRTESKTEANASPPVDTCGSTLTLCGGFGWVHPRSASSLASAASASARRASIPLTPRVAPAPPTPLLAALRAATKPEWDPRAGPAASSGTSTVTS